MLDMLAERLAGHVDAGEQLEAGLLPSGHAAVENGEVSVTGACQHFGCALRQAVAVIDQYDACGMVRHKLGETQLQPTQRHIACPEQMAQRESQLLADIDRRDLRSIGEHGAEGLGETERAVACEDIGSFNGMAELVPAIPARWALVVPS